jgi:hypothetical protein
MLALLPPSTSARSPIYEPPAEASSCLNGASLYAAGPSEVMQLLGWLTGGEQQTKRASALSPDAADWNLAGGMRSLGCTTRRNLAMRFMECKQHDYAARGKCREELYARRPFEANCTGRTTAWRNATFSVHGYWKSFQYTQADLAMHSAMQQELEQTRTESPAATDARARLDLEPSEGLLIVQLSAGLQQFARIPGREEKQLHLIEDSATLPQEWVDQWLNETDALFRLFSPHQWRRASTTRGQTQTNLTNLTNLTQDLQDDHRPVCVVWRAQNIAARHTNLSEPRHHPSSINGVHHWINRLGIALARLHGLDVIDYTDFTTSHWPAPSRNTHADERVAGASPAEARKADALEGDVYHGYDMRELAPRWLSALAKACCPPH